MEVGNTKGVFVFSEKSLLTSYVCAVQTTRRRFALQTVCFLEDISLKNVFKPMGVLFPTQTWSSVFPHLPTSSNPLSTPLLLISKQRHLFSILFFPTLVPSPSHPTQPPLRSSFSSYVAGHHHLLLHSHQQHLPNSTASADSSPTSTATANISPSSTTTANTSPTSTATAVEVFHRSSSSVKVFHRLQKLKNKQSSSCRLQRFGPPLLLQMSADVVRRLQTLDILPQKKQTAPKLRGGDNIRVWFTVMEALVLCRRRSNRRDTLFGI
ncbi:hypothetical protein HanHA300_Chr12g0430821 [Helianthus annuus]|nr:hypothetical protein HanHA300_Chr12g0430821 [Helianthus annuus]